MGEHSTKKEIIKKIRSFRSEYQIAEYIEQNIPAESFENEQFVEDLISANPLVKGALESVRGTITKRNITSEIEERGLEAVIEDEKKLGNVPKEYKEQLYDIAKKYEQEEEFEKAKIIYSRIIDFGVTQTDKFYRRYETSEQKRETIYYKAKYFYYICKLQNGEELTDSDFEELKQLAKEDSENILNLSEQGKMTTYEIYESLFEDITLEQIGTEILPMITNKGDRKSSYPYPGPIPFPNPNPKPKTIPNPEIDTENDDPLSPAKILKYIKENYDIESCKVGKGIFTGNIIFKIKDSDVVIVEKFFSVVGRKNDKRIVPATGNATYFVHKDADIDFKSTSRSKLVERKRSERAGTDLPLIDSVNHLGDYYSNFKKRYEKIGENGKIRKSIEGQETDNIEIIDEDENIEPIVNEENTNPEIQEVLETIETELKPEQELETDSDIHEEENNEEITEEAVETPIVNNRGQNTEPGNMEGAAEEKSDSEEVEVDLSTYTSDDLIAYAQLLDEDLEKFEKELTETQKKILETEGIVQVLKERLTNKFKENLSIVTKQEGLRRDLATHEELMDELKKISKMKEEIIEAKNKNRSERDRVQKEFEKRILGE